MTTAKSYTSVLEAVVDVAPATRSFLLRLPAGRGMTFEPGQFISLQLPLGDKPLPRAYSIASDPSSPELLEICLNLVPNGPGSTYLFALREGASIDFTGPWGSFVVGTPAPERCFFVAQGPGVAPMRPMVGAALERGVTSVLLLHAAAAEADLLYRSKFDELARAEGRFRYHELVGDREPSHSLLLAKVQERFGVAEGSRGAHFFVCGVGDIVTRLRDLLRGAGHERGAVHYEKW